MNINKLNRKISKIVLMLLFIILSTSSMYKVHALPVTLELLESSTDYYCSEHNVPLAYYNPEYTEDGRTYSSSDPYGSYGSSYTTHNQSTYNNLMNANYTKRENSDFSNVGESYTTPVEAWVLINGNGYGSTDNPTPWQQKWWTTPAGQGHLHTTTGDRDVNLQYPEDEEHAFSSELFNNDNRAVAVNGTSLLKDFIESENSRNTFVEVAGRMTNFAAGDGESDGAQGGSVSEADDFADYIEAMTGSKNSVCGSNGFNFTKKFDWINKDVEKDGKKINYSNPTVAKDGNKFIVGPFAIDYVNKGKFSHIANMVLEVKKDDGTTQNLVINSDKSEFKLNKESNGKFPLPDETFYIVFDSIKNATSIKNIKVNFEYMNATAKYSLWDGSITITGIQFADDGSYTPQGSSQRVYKIRRVESSSTQNAQTVAHKEEECKLWYEHVQIERGINIIESNINIIKKITTSDGKEIDYNSLSKDAAARSFDFELEVNGAITNDNLGSKEKITVMAGSGLSTQSRVYYWLNNNNNNAPTFTLKEINKEGYHISDIKEVTTNGHGTYSNGVFTGTLTTDTSLNLEATNITDSHIGNIKIVKAIDSKISEAGKNYINGKTFDVKVTITPSASGFFKYNGVYYGNNEENKSLEITVQVVAGGEVKLPSDIEWYGEEAPTYKAEEILTEEQKQNIELLKIDFAEGKLVEYKTGSTEPAVTVTVTNTSKDHKAKIHIIKTVEITNDYSEELKQKLIEKIKNQTYEFDIKVNGFDTEHAVIEKAEIKDNQLVWDYVSSEYTWQGDANNGPTYEIKEVNAPEGTVCEPENTSGKLIENVQNDYKVDNNILNKITIKEHNAKIKLIKKIDGKELQDEDYTFDLRMILGLFTYKGKVYEPTKETPVRFTNAEGADEIASSDEQYIVIHIEPEKETAEWELAENITWYEYGTELTENPHYEVHEVKVPEEKVKNVQIMPQEGEGILIENESKLLEITATNYGFETKKGKIHLIKELENAERYDEAIINTYKFQFRVSLDYNADDNWDDAETFDIELTPKKIDNDSKFIWEWESDPINWKENETAPKYKIEEINIPAGIEFVEAKDETNSYTVDGNTITGTIVEFKEEDIEFKQNEVSVKNKIVENQNGKLAIKKFLEDGSESLKDKEFEFDVTVQGTFTYNEKEYNNEKYTFTTKVKAGETWTSDDFTWSSIAVPSYTVVEKEGQEYECISMINNAGYLKNNDTVTATFTNKSNKTESAYLRVTKSLEAGQTSDKKFKFEITIDGKTTTIELKAGEVYTSESYIWNIGETAPSYTVTELPNDETILKDIREIGGSQGIIGNGGKGGTITGTLKEGTTVEVVATNSIDERHGQFNVKKQIVADEKYVAGVKDKEFTITATITGNFMYGDNKTPVNGSQDFEFTLKADGTWTSPTIYWNGENAPIVTVKENLTGDAYKGWKNIGISNNDVAISDGLEIVVTNEYQIITRLDLTVELAGDVWEDVPQKDSKNDPDSVPNGKIDKGEIGIDGVEVYIYKSGTNELATIYKDGLNAKLTQPIITSNNGHWDAPRVNLSDSEDQFEVRFVYDGQTYENTELLVTANGKDSKSKIDEFMGTIRKSDRNKYAKDSMAEDTNREEVNSRINEIYGNAPIDGNGNTTGKVRGAAGEFNVYYTSNVTNLGDQTRVISKLKTTNSNGVALDPFKTIASTGRLVFPFGTGFEDKFHLTGSDTNITDYGTEIVYHYSATYDYTKHINLGLKKRTDSDVEIQKDLVSAKVVVNDRLTNYTFNKLSDIGKDVYTRTIDDSNNPDNINLNYTLGLYKTDYYYRAEMYKTNMPIDEYEAVENFYKAVSSGIDSTELEVYLQYKITLRNSSSNTYKVRINEIEDYYDSTFKLIKEETKRYVKNTDGKLQEDKVVVGKAPYIEKGTFTSSIDFRDGEKGIKGSDGVTYNKISANLGGIELASGETANVYTSFQVEKGTFKGVQDAIALGGKSNLAEISNYSTYYANGKVAGKIDRDSAPANIDVRNHNIKNWYEDDADIAPVLNLKINENDRAVEGIAWEDKALEGTSVGNGIYDESDEALIGGLTTELVEKVTIKDSNNNFVDYDFVWPTSERLNALGGMSMEELTGFDSVIETSRGIHHEDGTVTDVGKYSFTGAPTGDYVVRFVYGDNKANLDTTMGMTGNAVAYKNDGNLYFNNNDNDDNKANTSNYDKEAKSKLATVYNGQDYKSTIYQAEKASTNADGYINNEWHNLNNQELNNASVSDARDSEARRLEVIANSQTITNENGSVLYSANDRYSSHTELYNDYYMFADTAKLNMSIENLSTAQAVMGIQEMEGLASGNGVQVDVNKYNYEVPRIDFGLIERPKNEIILDKQISSIKIITNDGKAIFDAEYDISYELKDKNLITDLVKEDKVLALINRNGEKYLVAKVTLNKDKSTGIDVLQAIDKKENKIDANENDGKQNFRFINVDEDILQGTTIEVNYKLTALNVGENDYTSTTLAEITGTTSEIRNEILNKAKEAEKANTVYNTNTNNYQIGSYLGRFYYTGNSDNDAIVTTKVRQVAEYIDNDGVFSSENNNTENHSWRSTSARELAGQGFSKNRIVDDNITVLGSVYDKNGKLYLNNENNNANKNVALSVDTDESVETSMTNKDFEAKLEPVNASQDSNYKSEINITVTKVVSAEDDADNLTFDNIAEIVKYENSVGRRDITAVPGNSNPKAGEFVIGLKERDSSATELVTFTPPTGIESQSVMTSQVLIIVVVALGIIAIGIVVIKKKILTK